MIFTPSVGLVFPIEGVFPEPDSEPTEQAWADGFFDGEGPCYFGKDPMVIACAVQQSHTATLHRFSAATGHRASLYGPYQHKPSIIGTVQRKPMWMLQTGRSENAILLMRTLWPYLSPVKRQQFIDAVSAYQAAKAQKKLGQLLLPA